MSKGKKREWASRIRTLLLHGGGGVIGIDGGGTDKNPYEYE
jgi:hypothetical protein